MTLKQIEILNRYKWPKGTSGNPKGNGRAWYIERYGIEYKGRELLPKEIAEIFGISVRQVRNRINAHGFDWLSARLAER